MSPRLRRRPSTVGILAMLGLAGVAWLGPTSLQPVGITLSLLAIGCIGMRRNLLRLGAGWTVGVVGLLACAVLALYPSTNLALSLPKLCGIVLGIATFAMLAGAAPSRRQLVLVSWSVLVVAVVIGVSGALVTDWPRDGGKSMGLATAYNLLPELPDNAPDWLAGSLNPNKLAAPLAMLLPLLVGIVVFARPRPQRLAAVAVALLVALELLLTQSRSAYLAAMAAVLMVLTLRWRWLGVLLVPYVAIVGWVLVYILGARVPPPPMTEGITQQLEERRLVWNIGASMVLDFPLTGIGLGTFPDVAHRLYGQSLLIGPETDTPHAHNLALQVAVDLGLPGLVFFVLLSVSAARAGGRAFRRAPGSAARGLASGSAGALLAYYLFGLTDAIGLGEKPGLIFWVCLGILLACARLAEVGTGTRRMLVPEPPPTLVTRTQPLVELGQVGSDRGVGRLG